MSTKKKLLQAAAGSAGGAGGLNVEEVFSTYLYEGNSTQRDITNSVDLSTEGGLVWIKNRGTSASNHLYDTERGATKRLVSDSTGAEYSTTGYGVIGFNTDGFELGTHSAVNYTGEDMCSWTFRKAPKFFDVVEFTYTGSAQISHNLGGKVGAILMKRTDAAQDWLGWFYRGSAAGSGYYLSLNTTNSNAGARVDTEHSDTYFNPAYVRGSNSGGTVSAVSGGTYVAYLFAHNDGDGDFGPDGDADIIKCGSYTGNGSTNGPEIDLGFEPQWVLQKRSDNTGNWRIFDNMRGLAVGGSDAQLFPNNSDAEASSEMISLTPTGFQLTTTTSNLNASGGTYIYIAIRRGPMAVPESATDVFAVDDVSNGASEPDSISGFPVDFVLRRYINTTNNWVVCDRLRNHYHLKTNSTDAEAALNSSTTTFDYMNGVNNIFSSNNTDFYHWMWRRAPNFCDVVAYTGTGSARTVSHNLGAAPEMMWIKRRDAISSTGWAVYHSAISPSGQIFLNSSGGYGLSGSAFWNSTAPTDSVFSLGTYTDVNNASGTYIAYLFASLDGVSKVGSYTGNNSTQNIDCGFSSGARFVLIKRTDSTGDWHLFDTERGIVTGAFDPYLELNTTQEEADAASGMGGNYIEPYSGGFALNANSLTNGLNAEYIFYAIA